MQRHYSDSGPLFRTLQHTPQRPSRLNPALEGRRGSIPAALQGRGTVSMPTSPLRRNAVLPWAEPHSAQAYFGQDQMDIDPSSPFHPVQAGSETSTPYFVNEYQSPISTQPDPFHLTDSSRHIPKLEQEYDPNVVHLLSAPHTPLGSDYHASPHQTPEWVHDRAIPTGEEMEIEEDENDHDSSAKHVQSRRKRQQVTVACTHCQKACKKCSNTRPCERCVKYNLTDCVDSTRKPRKTGVKRGPYRSRKSISNPRLSVSNQAQPYESSSSPQSLHDPPPFHDSQNIPSAPPGPGYGGQSEQHISLPPVQAYGYTYQPQSTQLHHRQVLPIQPIRQASPPVARDQHEVMYARQQQQVYHLRQLQMREQLGQRQRQPSVYSGQNHHARSQSGRVQPTWTHSESNPTHRTQIVHSLSPTLPAPRQSKLESALSAALSGISAQPRWINGQRVQVQEGAGTLLPQINATVPFPLSLQRSGRGVDPFSRAVSPIKAFQFGSRTAEDSTTAAQEVLCGDSNPDQEKTNSSSDDYQPYQAPNHKVSSPNPWPTSQNETTTIALKRVRKPSLRTLMVPGISREGSPVDSPGAGIVSGNWKPGLAMITDFEGRHVVDGSGNRRDGTMSPTLFQGDVEGVEDIQWGF